MRYEFVSLISYVPSACSSIMAYGSNMMKLGIRKIINTKTNPIS